MRLPAIATRLRTGLLVLLFGVAAPAGAATSILVLDFGLRDDTLLPDVPAEVARVAQLAPWVRRRLDQLGDSVAEVAVPPELTELSANGYLLAHPERAAELGRTAGARWVLIGYSNKFSFLISWVRAFLVDTRDGKIVARAEADLRGAMDDARMTRRTAFSLAEQVHDLAHSVETARHAPPP
ncbi:MAG: DUF2380 domain-containing protein [Gammaproteobacteria bacterium]|nr:DUF2380 domain-containing protein [Gammaproteobacteria bacterium]MCP5199930.1 DUF2380 domain-containing protein [Gammaproteobacteria bacterium]